MSNIQEVDIAAYDAGPKWGDRYTIVIDSHGYGMSHNPLHPMGFNQYIGELGKDFDLGALGKRVPVSTLPTDVQTAIELRIAIDLET